MQDAQKGRSLRTSFVKRRSSLVTEPAAACSRDTLHDSRVPRPLLAEFFSILLGGGLRRCPEKRVHKGSALKILQVFNRLSDSDQPHGQFQFLGDRDDDPSASGAV